jgi:peroxiredoxin-like protein
MKSLPHHYDVHLTGGPAGYAQVSSAGLPELRTAPPADYDGPGDAWSPEHLLLASVQTCLLFTLRAVARLSKVEFTNLEVDATGTVDRQEGVTRFTEIVLRPRLTVPAGTSHERALRVLEKSEKSCLVSASLSVPIHLEATIQGAAESVPT